jgi:hypothetical protein
MLKRLMGLLLLNFVTLAIAFSPKILHFLSKANGMFRTVSER